MVVELFTSEGCSSCPPGGQSADAAGAIAFPDIEVIPLSEHVDYWNHLGWKDRFSSPLFSARQQDYGRTFSLESVYTPQMVVNGQAEFNGSDAARAQQEIRRPRRARKQCSRSPCGPNDVAHLQVQGSRGRSQRRYVSGHHGNGLETTPRGGENNGHRLRHIGVVADMTSIGQMDTKKAASYVADAKMNLNPKWSRENLKLVWFVQDRSNRKILGAATARP